MSVTSGSMQHDALGGLKNFSSRLGIWLQNFRLTDDPFALYEAGRENEVIQFFFVDRPYLHDLLGKPDRPQSAILFAERGHGKSATCEMVDYECLHGRLKYSALAVPYTDFSAVLKKVNGDAACLTTEHHVDWMIRLILKSIAEHIPVVYFDGLIQGDRELLNSFADAFADPITRRNIYLLTGPGSVSMEITWDNLTALERLEALLEIFSHLNLPERGAYKAVYVLIDRVDETSAGAAAAMDILKPLLSTGPLLNLKHLGFKLFLPAGLQPQIKTFVSALPDRMKTHWIEWDDLALRTMLDVRLQYYSDDYLSCIEDICDPGLKTRVVKELLNASQRSPRTLLRLAQQLIFSHIYRLDAPSALLDKQDLFRAIQTLDQEIAQPVPTVLPDPFMTKTGYTSPVVPLAHGLYMDPQERIFIDGAELQTSLSRQERSLLRLLYSQVAVIVPNHQIIRCLWPEAGQYVNDEKMMRNYEQSLRKVVDRLRSRLGGGDNKERFIVNARGWGYKLMLDSSQ